MELIREFTRTGGLNLDDSFESVPNGDYVNAWNAVKRSLAGASDQLETVVGNTQINASSFGNTAGKFTFTDSVCIGKINAPKDDITYLFYYGVTRPHCILKLDANAATVSLVIAWTGLNFVDNTQTANKDKRISGFVVEGPSGDLLCFTDNNLETRCVHTTRYAGGSVPTNQEELYFLKRGPYYAPTVKSVTTAFAGTSNNEIYNDWVFATQYVYFDNQVSVLSPYSAPVRRLGPGFVYDTITVDWSATASGYGALDSIPILVKEIKLYVKKGFAGTFVQCGTSGVKNLVSDAFGTSTVAFTGTSGALIEDHYTQQFELFPQQVGDMVMAANRTWIANFVDGYAKYSSTNITGFNFSINTTDVTPNGVSKSFSPFSLFKGAFLLRDAQGRAGGVVTDPSFLIRVPSDALSPFYNTQGPVQKITIGATLANLPAWVRDVGFVMTKDLNKSYFKHFVTLGATYCSLDATDTETNVSSTYVNQQYIKFPLGGTDYAFASGDQVAFNFSSPGSTVGIPYTLSVEKYVNGSLYCTAQNLGTSTFGIGDQRTISFVMIYRPLSDDAANAYFEVGPEVQATPASVIRNYVTPTAGTAVLSITLEGDSMLLGPTKSSLFSTVFYYIAPYMKASNAWNTFHGRPFVESRIDGVTKSTWFRYGSAYTSSVAVNQLAEFTTLSEKNVSPSSGKIQKLWPTVRDSTQSSAILVICNTDTYTIYINEALVTQGVQSSIVASASVIGDLRLQQSGYGTLHPESIVSDTNGHIYWYDMLGGVYVRYANNGIFPVSNYKVSGWFQTVSFALQPATSYVLSAFDPYYKMIFVKFRGYQNCIGYHIPSERWVSFYAIDAEQYYAGAKSMYSFIGGKMRIHSDQSPATSFTVSQFGFINDVQYTTYVDLSFNELPDTLKNWRVIQMHMSPNMRSYSGGVQFVSDQNLKVTATNRDGQSTTLVYRSAGEPEFDVEENLIYGAFKNDESLYGVWITGDHRLLYGDPMYSTSLQVRVEWGGGATAPLKWLRYVKVGDMESRGHSV